VQWCVAEVASFVHINTGVNQSLSSSEVAPSHNTMKRIVAIAPGCIYVRKINVSEIPYFVQSRKYLFKLVVHGRHECSLYTLT
jgi:hypothetical protein